MKVNDVRCVTLGAAKRIMSQGRVAVGYPLPSGDWSIQGGPYADGDEIHLRIMSRNGGKIHAEVDAVVRDMRIDGRGAFIAHFTPVKGTSAQ